MRILAALLLGLLAVELLLRVYHHHTVRQRLPSELRAETRALVWADIADRYRIVCLGDSITFGEGLSYAQAYPSVLATLLNERHPGLNAVTINSGIRGNTAVQGLARLERDVLWYRPHLVVVAFGLNDAGLGRWPLDPLREREICGDTSLLGHVEPLLGRSHLWQTARARFRRLLKRFGCWRPPMEIDRMAEPRARVSQPGFELALRRLATSIQKQGRAKLLLLTTTPVAESFNSDSDPGLRQQQLRVYDEYNRIVRQVARDCGAYLVDVHTTFGGRSPAESAALWAADGVHLTPAGERMVAECVLQALETDVFSGDDSYQRR